MIRFSTGPGNRIIPAVFVLCAAFAARLPAEEPARAASGWMQWRGPAADGCAASDARPPIVWDAATNIRWTAVVPGEGAATPIVSDQQVFVLSAEITERQTDTPVAADEQAKTVPPTEYYRFLVTSMDRATGSVRWQQLATEQVPHEGHHPSHTFAAGSPTTDGERLYATFGSRGFYCYALDGTLLWSRDLGDLRTRFGWGEAVTPVLADDLLIVNWDQEQDSFITALDKRTGQDVWRVDRPGEVTSWNTPLVTESDGRLIVIVNGTQRVRCYDARTGEELWSCGGQSINAIPSPVRFAETAICMSGYRSAAAFAIPLNSSGDITGSDAIRWQHHTGTPYVPSPAVSGQRILFTAGNTDVLSCLDARSGQPLIDRRRLPGVGSLYASPLVAGGHVYFTGREGTTVVLKDNETLDVAAVNVLNDAIDASPVAVGRQLFLRSRTRLYCIEE